MVALLVFSFPCPALPDCADTFLSHEDVSLCHSKKMIKNPMVLADIFFRNSYEQTMHANTAPPLWYAINQIDSKLVPTSNLNVCKPKPPLWYQFEAD